MRGRTGPTWGLLLWSEEEVRIVSSPAPATPHQSGRQDKVVNRRRVRTAGWGWPPKNKRTSQGPATAPCPPSALHPCPASQARRSPRPRAKDPPSCTVVSAPRPAPAERLQLAQNRPSTLSTSRVGWAQEGQRTRPERGWGGGGSWVLGLLGFHHHLPIHSLSSITLEPSDSCWLLTTLGSYPSAFPLPAPLTECPEADWSPSLRCPGPNFSHSHAYCRGLSLMALCHSP